MPGCMTRRRLTREESREQTQQRLLDAALHVIARKGLAATSVEDIAAQAGYTRGAFYSNFRGKNDLFIELLRRDHERTTAGMNALLAGGLPPGQLELQLKQFYSQMYLDNECFMNWTEAHMLAARDAKFRARLNALLLEKRDAIAAFIVQFCRRLGMPPPAPPEQMAMGFISLVQGVRLFRISIPQEMAAEAAESILALFIEGVITVGKLRAAQ
jgi:AcrR family transcriptional regulator